MAASQTPSQPIRWPTHLDLPCSEDERFDYEKLKSLRLPTHLDLPWSDDNPVDNSIQPRQCQLLSSSVYGHLDALHPQHDYYIGEDVAIYWRLNTSPAEGRRVPDWFYVPNVPRLLDGEARRSYVLWNEIFAPLLLVEIVSGDGSEELDRTPHTGKFWVYEQGIRAAYYAIHWMESDRLEVYGLDRGTYRPIPANERGRFPVPEMGVELGVWDGTFMEYTTKWLRFWDSNGELLLTGDERAEREKLRAERLADKLRQLGVDPNGG